MSVPTYLAITEATALLHRAADVLDDVASVIAHTQPKPKARAAMRRCLSGVLADVETVRLAIKEARA